MRAARDTKALIAGAGPAGLVTGLALVRNGFHVTIADEERRPAAHSYAVVVHPTSLERLDRLGVAHEVLQQGRRVDKMVVHDGARPVVFEMGRLSTRFPFAVTLSQEALERTLADHLRTHGVDIGWNRRLTAFEDHGSSISATLQKWEKVPTGYVVASHVSELAHEERVDADYLVGADGHVSTIRRQLGIEQETMGRPEVFGIFELETDGRFDGDAHLVFHQRTANALWPLPGDRCRWSFELPNGGERAERRAKSRVPLQVGPGGIQPHLSAEDLRTLIGQRAPWFEARIRNIPWALAVRFDRRLATRFGRSRVWLVGDSAHLASPLGAHSMNIAMAEGVELADAIRDAARVKQPHPLTAYDERARQRWAAVFAGRAVAGPETPESLRPVTARLGEALPAVGGPLRELLAQQDIRESASIAAAE